MKWIGVICLNSYDFHNYMKYYLDFDEKDIISKGAHHIKTEKYFYVGIYHIDHFCGCTFHYYLFTPDSVKNTQLLDIITKTKMCTYKHN